MKQVAAKILKVMEALGPVLKDKKNAFHGYNYVSDESLVKSIRDEIIKNKLVVIPNQVSCAKENDITTLQVNYTIIDTESGESIQSTAFGQGQDKGDKGPYKAATGAEKYFLLKSFLIPTSDDPENDNQKTNGNGAAKPVSVGSTREAEDIGMGEQQYTSIFTLSEPFESKKKKGSFYYKAMDSEGVPYYVFDKTVADGLKLNEGKPVTVLLKTEGKFTHIEGLL